MKAKDLMIGDWVLIDFAPRNKYYEPGIITGLCSEEAEFEAKNQDGKLFYTDDEKKVLPVPLTAEVLEKNGFEELMNESEVSAARFGRKPEPTGVWQYGFGQFDSVAYVPEQSFLRIKFMEGCQADIANIKYVHELQHALRLCGIEKEINL